LRYYHFVVFNASSLNVIVMRSSAIVLFLSLPLLSACDRQTNQSALPTTPTAPTPSVQQPYNPPRGNWTGEATVLSRTGSGGCGWGTQNGEVRVNVEWSVSVSGATVSLDEDMRNWPTDDVPFNGTLSGRTFNTSYHQGPDYARYVCAFREATLAGTFSEDFTTFEAIETLYWGTPENQAVVQRHWIGTRLY
jgi:hypothetical protein